MNNYCVIETFLCGSCSEGVYILIDLNFSLNLSHLHKATLDAEKRPELQFSGVGSGGVVATRP